jgi:hypothetical protein
MPDAAAEQQRHHPIAMGFRIRKRDQCYGFRVMTIHLSTVQPQLATSWQIE